MQHKRLLLLQDSLQHIQYRQDIHRRLNDLSQHALQTSLVNQSGSGPWTVTRRKSPDMFGKRELPPKVSRAALSAPPSVPFFAPDPSHAGLRPGRRNDYNSLLGFRETFPNFFSELMTRSGSKKPKNYPENFSKGVLLLGNFLQKFRGFASRRRHKLRGNGRWPRARVPLHRCHDRTCSRKLDEENYCPVVCRLHCRRRSREKIPTDMQPCAPALHAIAHFEAFTTVAASTLALMVCFLAFEFLARAVSFFFSMCSLRICILFFLCVPFSVVWCL